MSLNNSAYMKEALRGALMSVEKGQIEAGLSLGYTERQVIRYIVFPQAGRVAVPALANSFIDIIKGSAMAFTVGVIEITAAAQLYAASTFRFFEGYCGLIFMYWLLVVILEKILRLIEKTAEPQLYVKIRVIRKKRQKTAIIVENSTIIAVFLRLSPPADL